MLMSQAVARHIAQLLENHWTGNISPTHVSGTTFSHKHKAALFYQICFSFLIKLKVVHTSYHNGRQCSTDKNCSVFIIVLLFYYRLGLVLKLKNMLLIISWNGSAVDASI